MSRSIENNALYGKKEYSIAQAEVFEMLQEDIFTGSSDVREYSVLSEYDYF